ncbi:hypothetical protein SteCoe_22210 [Stentor coeruleus]|uniref:Uncharacterized protein n=1 Tax=Stentor coeruleus TaxID=5963 RepID=A0A1R2BNA7_9CILI|nr:hypothetical protein SteCoe_22210 [Stentor coeruleus]
MEVESYPDEKKFLFRPIHPRVAKVLMDLKSPSPCRVVRDALQPITGSLSDRPSYPLILNADILPKKTEKKELTLNLSLSQIKNRRAILQKN